MVLYGYEHKIWLVGRLVGIVWNQYDWICNTIKAKRLMLSMKILTKLHETKTLLNSFAFPLKLSVTL